MWWSALLVSSCLGYGEPVGVDDWPGWRGPGASGLGTGSPPAELTEETLRWKVEVPGRGLSCPVVVGDRIYLSTAISKAEAQEGEQAGGGAEGGGGRGAGGRGGDDRGGRGGSSGRGGGFGRGGPPPAEHAFAVMAFDRADGSPVWSKTVHTGTPHEGVHSDSTFATPTLVTDGTHLVASFGSNGIFVLDMNGEPMWNVDLGDMSVRGSFGEGASPALHEEVLVINWDHEGESFIVAMDVTNGEELWRNERPQGTSWTSPVIVDVEGESQVVVAGARTVAYDLQLGEEVWFLGKAPEAAPEGDGGRGGFGGGRGGRGSRGGRSSGVIASPVMHDGILYVTTGDRGGSMYAIRLADADGEVGVDCDAIVWSQDRDLPRIPSPIVVGDSVYVMKSNSGILSAFSLEDGSVRFSAARMEGVANAYASPVAADGRIYFASRDGVIEVVKAGETYETLGVHEFDDSFDASPALVGDTLLVRGRQHLYCFGSK